MILHVPIFHGIAPRLAPRKLSQAQGQIARNCELFSEELRPIRESIEVVTPAKDGVKQAIYKLVDLWLHWLTDVDVARSPLYLENENRIHYSGDNNPKSTDLALAQSGITGEYPETFYRLGLPRPDTAPTVGHTGGTGNDVQRSYVYTFVTAWGEEGPPSPAGTHVGKADATSWGVSTIDASPPNQWTHAADITSIVSTLTVVTVTLKTGSNHFLETSEYVTISGTTTGAGSLPDDIIGTWQVTRVDEVIFTFEVAVVPTGNYTGGAVIDREAPLQTTSMEKRLYRSLGGNFRFVADGITGTTYPDITADEDLGELLPGGIDEPDWWKAPNGDMVGLIAFPGGIMAGFFGNTLAMSVPNIPSAWPEAYQYTFNFNIVSIGVVANTVVIATVGNPSAVTGDHPSAMVSSDLEIFQSCVSKRGTVSLFNGVMYPSPDGIVYVPSVGVPQIITQPFFKKKDWQKIAPATLVATLYDDRYYGFYTGGGENSDESGAIIFDPKEPGATFTTLVFQEHPTALHSDLESDTLYMMKGDEIAQYDAGGGFLTYTWLSKLFTTRYPVCFKAAKVKLTSGDGVSDGDYSDALDAATAALEARLEGTAISATFGTSNNYDSGAIGGYAVAQYEQAGGPYTQVSGSIGSPVFAFMRLYSQFDNGSGTIERHLVHEESLLDDKPFRLPGGYLADQWDIELNGSDVRIHEVLLGTSMRELAKA
jgi:hypothetical protein